MSLKYVTLNKLLYLSKPQFLHPYAMIVITLEENKIDGVNKVVRMAPNLWKGSINVNYDDDNDF